MNADQQRILSLREELNRHNYDYYVLSNPTISDFEFDQKMRELQDLEALHPELDDPNSPSRRVGSDLSIEFKQVKHQYPMLSLGNTYSQSEVADFFDRVSRGLGGAPFEIVRHGKAYEPDISHICFGEVYSPVERNIASFDDQVLMVLNSSLDYLSDDRPKILRKGIVIFRRQRGVPAADHTHLQMIDGQTGIQVLLKHPLCQ